MYNNESLLSRAYASILDTKKKLNDNTGFKKITIADADIIKDSYIDFTKGYKIPLHSGYNAIMLNDAFITDLIINKKYIFTPNKIYTLLEISNILNIAIMLFNNGKLVDINKISVYITSTGTSVLIVGETLANTEIFMFMSEVSVYRYTTNTTITLDIIYRDSYAVFIDGYADHIRPSISGNTFTLTIPAAGKVIILYVATNMYCNSITATMAYNNAYSYIYYPTKVPFVTIDNIYLFEKGVSNYTKPIGYTPLTNGYITPSASQYVVIMFYRENVAAYADLLHHYNLYKSYITEYIDGTLPAEISSFAPYIPNITADTTMENMRTEIFKAIKDFPGFYRKYLEQYNGINRKKTSISYANISFTRNSTAPSLIDKLKVLPINKPRFTPGSGLNKGLMIEGDITNLISDPMYTNGIATDAIGSTWSITSLAHTNNKYIEYQILNNAALYIKTVITDGLHHAKITTPSISNINKSAYCTIQFKRKDIKIDTLSLYASGSVVGINDAEISLESYLINTIPRENGYTEYTYRVPPLTFNGSGSTLYLDLRSNPKSYDYTEFYLKEFQVIDTYNPMNFTNGTRAAEKLTANATVLTSLEGSIDIWVTPMPNCTGTILYMPYSIPEYAFNLYVNTLGYLSFEGRGPSSRITASTIWEYNIPHLITVCWKLGSFYLYLDGVLVGSRLNMAYPYITAAMNIGHKDGTTYGNIIFNDIRYSKTSRTEYEISVAYSTKSKLVVDSNTVFKMDFNDSLLISKDVLSQAVTIANKCNQSNKLFFNGGLRVMPAKITKSGYLYYTYFRLCDITSSILTTVDIGEQISPYLNNRKVDDSLQIIDGPSSRLYDNDDIKIFSTGTDVISDIIGEEVTAITTDSIGSIYIGSGIGTIRRLNSDLSIAQTYELSPGYKINTILEKNGKLYVGGDSETITVLDSTTLLKENESIILGAPVIKLEYLATNNSLYCIGGFPEYTLKRLDADTLTITGQSIEYPGNIKAMCIGKYDKIYIGGSASSFLIPANIFTPAYGDTISLYYKGIRLDAGIHYTLNLVTNVVDLKFKAGDTIDDQIDCIIHRSSYIDTNAYMYTAVTNNDTSFTLSTSIYTPFLGDILLLYYNGLKLETGEHYGIDMNTNRILLNFPLSVENNDKIQCVILRANTQYKCTPYVYVPSTNGETSFTLPTDAFNPTTDSLVMFYRGLKLYVGDNYTLSGNTINLDFPIYPNNGDNISCLIFNYTLPILNVHEYNESTMMPVIRIDPITLINEKTSGICGNNIHTLLAHSNGSIYAGISNINRIRRLDYITLNLITISNNCNMDFTSMVEGYSGAIYIAGGLYNDASSTHYNKYNLVEYSPISMQPLRYFDKYSNQISSIAHSSFDNSIILADNGSPIVRVHEDSMDYVVESMFEEVTDYTFNFDRNVVTINITNPAYVGNTVHICTTKYNTVVSKPLSNNSIITLPTWACFIPENNIMTFLNGRLMPRENVHIFNPFKYTVTNGDTVLCLDIDTDVVNSESISVWLTSEFEMVEYDTTVINDQKLIQLTDTSYPFSNIYNMVFIDGKLIDTPNIRIISDYIISINAPSISNVCILRKVMRNIEYSDIMQNVVDKWSDIISVLSTTQIETLLGITLNSVVNTEDNTRQVYLTERHLFEILYWYTMHGKDEFTPSDATKIRAQLPGVFLDNGNIPLSSKRANGIAPRYVL